MQWKTLTINSQAVNGILLHKVGNPVTVLRDDSGVSCVEIRKRNYCIAQPADLLAGCVAPVNGTIRVVEGLTKGSMHFRGAEQR